ncbi:hypothetical protein VaNZ11_010389, partial [Volvox africanus]
CYHCYLRGLFTTPVLAASKIDDDHDPQDVQTKELRGLDKITSPIATYEPKDTNGARCIEPKEDKCKQEASLHPGEDYLGRTSLYSARQHNEETRIAAPASLPDQDNASMLPGTQLLATQMHPQHHLLGNTSPFLWEQQARPVELGGSLAVVSSSGGQRTFTAFPAESGIPKNASYFSPGAGPGTLQPGWAEGHLLPHPFNGLQVPLDVQAVFTTPAMSTLSPVLAPATISALPQSQSLSAAGPCSASSAGEISSVGGIGDLQRPLGLSMPAAAAAGGGGDSSASPQQQIHLGSGPPHVSTPLSLGQGPLGRQQHEGLLPVTTSAQRRAAVAELATSTCPAVPPGRQGGAPANGLCAPMNAATSNPTIDDGGGGSLTATGIDPQPLGPNAQVASASIEATAQKQYGGLSLRRIKPAAVDLHMPPNLVEQRQSVQQPVQQQQQVLRQPCNAISGGSVSCLPGSYTQRPAFANFIGCESSISPAVPSEAATSSNAIASGSIAVTTSATPCTVAAAGGAAICPSGTADIGDSHEGATGGGGIMLGVMQPQQPNAAPGKAGVKVFWTPTMGPPAVAAAMSAAAAMSMWSGAHTPAGSYPFSTDVGGNSGMPTVAAPVITAAPAGGSKPLQRVLQGSSPGVAPPFMMSAQPNASSGLGGSDGDGAGPSDSTVCAGAVGGSVLAAAGTSDPGVSPFSSGAGVNADAAAPTDMLGLVAGSHRRGIPEPLQQQQQQQQQQQGQQLSHPQPSLPPQMAVPSVDSFADQFFAAMMMPSGGATTTPESIMSMQGTGSLPPAQAEHNSQQSALMNQEQRFAPLAVPTFNPSAIQLMAINQMAQLQQHHQLQSQPNQLQQLQQHQQAAAAMSLMQQMWRASLGLVMPVGMMGLGLGIPPGMVWPAQMGLTAPAAPDISAPPNMAAVAAAAAAAAATQFPALFNHAMMLPVLAPFALPLQAAAAAAVQPLVATTATAAAVPAVDASCTAAPASVGACIAASGCGAALRDAIPGTGGGGGGGGAIETAIQRQATNLVKSTKGSVKAEAALQVLDSAKRDVDKKKQQQPEQQQQQQQVGAPTSFSGPVAAACVPSTRGPSPPSSPPPQSPPAVPPTLVTQVRPDFSAFASAPAFLEKETTVTVDPQTAGADNTAGSSARSRMVVSGAIAAGSALPASGEKPPEMEARKRDDGSRGAAIEGANVAKAGSPKATGGTRLEATRLQSLASADLVVVDALQLLAASPPPSPHRERRTSGTSVASVNTAGGAGSCRSSEGGTATAAGEARTKVEAGRAAGGASGRPHPTQARRLFDLPDPAPIHRGQQVVGGPAAAALGAALAAARSGSGILADGGEGGSAGMSGCPAAGAAVGPGGWPRRSTPPPQGPSGTGTLDRQRLLHLAAVGVERVRRQGPVQAASASRSLGGVGAPAGVEEGQGTAYEPHLQLPWNARRRRTRVARAAAVPGGAFLAILQEVIEAAESEGLEVHSRSSPAAVDDQMEDLTPPGFLAAAPAAPAAALAGAAFAAYGGARRSSGGGAGGRRVQWAAGDECGEMAVRSKRLPTVRNGADVEAGAAGGEEEEDEDDWEEESQEGPPVVRCRSRSQRHRTPSESDGACEEDSDGEFHVTDAMRPARGRRRGNEALPGGPGAAVIAHRVRSGAGAFAADSDGADVLTSEDPGNGYGGGDGDDDTFSVEPVAVTRRRRSGHGRPPGAGNLRKMKPRKVQSDGRLGFSMRSSKYTGVYRTPGGRWRAQFCYRGAVHQLGMYDTEREAAAAWDQAVVTFRGSMSGVQLNLPQLLNSYDMQNVRDHIHRILDSKIATTRTKRCLNSYSRNPPGPKSPTRVVPAAVAAVDIVATETAVPDAVAELLSRGGGRVSGGCAGGASAANSGGLLSEEAAAAAAAAAGVRIGGGPSSRGLALVGPAAGGARRRRRSPSASNGGGWEGDDDQGEPGDIGSDGGADVTGCRKSVRIHTGTATSSGDGGVVPVFPVLSGGAGGLPQLAGQDGADSKQPQRLRVLSVDDAAMLGLAVLRRQLPHLIDSAEANTQCTAQEHPSAEGGAGHAAANTTAAGSVASRAMGPATTVADDTVATGKRPSEKAAGATTTCSLPSLNHGSAYAEGSARGGAIDSSISSSGGEGDGGGSRCCRPSSPKRRKSHAIRSRDH